MMLYINADTLTNKMIELQLLACDNKADIIIVTEIKPEYSLEPTTTQQLKLDGYVIYSNLEHQEASRGIAIYLTEKLSEHTTEINIASDFHECLWMSMNLRGNDKLLFGCIYRSPWSSIENDMSMYDLLHRISSLKATHLMIVGDFNYPNIDWSTTTTTKGNQHTNQKCIDIVRDVFLHQHVTEPIRYRHGQNSKVLDIILTNEENMIKSIEYIPVLGLSDPVC